MLVGYLLVAFGIGGGIFTVLSLFLFGPVARTFGLAHIKGDPILQIPTNDRRWDFIRVDDVDEKGRYKYETKTGKDRIIPIDPEDVNIAGGKVPLVIFLKNLARSISPLDAVAGELSVEEEDDKVTVSKVEPSDGFMRMLQDKLSARQYKEIKGRINDFLIQSGESVNFQRVKKKIQETLSPSHYASMKSSSMEASRPLKLEEGEGFDSGTALKIGGIGFVVILIIVGFYVATNMGLI